MQNSQLESEVGLLPFDDIVNYPNFSSKILATLMELTSHPFKSLRLISQAPVTNDAISYLIAITWPIHAITECFKYWVSHSRWLYNHYHLPLKENDSSVVWTLISILLFPVTSWVGFWFANFFNHLMLRLWRALHNGLGVDQTARANSFTIVNLTILSIPFSLMFAFTPVFQHFHVTARIISLILSVIWIFYTGLAYSRAHCTDVWRGIGASLTIPVLVIVLFSLFAKASVISILLR